MARLPEDPLSTTEIEALLLSCSRRAPTGIRNAALIAVLWRCGLRCAEALTLRQQDLDLDGGTLTVQYGKGGKRRIVGIDAGTRALLGEWVRGVTAATGLAEGIAKGKEAGRCKYGAPTESAAARSGPAASRPPKALRGLRRPVANWICCTMSRAELREMWRAAMSAAGGTQRYGGRRREPSRALFRSTRAHSGYLLFFPGEDGYELLDAGGRCPDVGDELDLDGFGYRVLKVGISPFPGDRQLCVFVERCDAPAGLAVD